MYNCQARQFFGTTDDYKAMLKDWVREAIPKPVFYGLKRQLALLRARDVRAAFSAAGTEPAYLQDADLEELNARFRVPPTVGYGPDETAQRGRKKAEFLQKLVDTPARPVASLELGCWDGMVAGALAANGWAAFGIDIREAGFDLRARREGANLRQMDAGNLAFPDDAFDFVYSFDAFEHFPDPGAVLSEAIRVTRDGGTIFIDFGPLYNSPYGLHAYKSVPVPYCQFLFAPEQLNAFTTRHSVPAIDFDQVNRWSLAQFRSLWRPGRSHLVPQWCFENYTSRGLDLVAKYPTCFRSKVDDLDELLVGSIRALFQVHK